MEAYKQMQILRGQGVPKKEAAIQVYGVKMKKCDKMHEKKESKKHEKAEVKKSTPKKSVKKK